jgi:hypothetical protein
MSVYVISTMGDYTECYLLIYAPTPIIIKYLFYLFKTWIDKTSGSCYGILCPQVKVLRKDLLFVVLEDKCYRFLEMCLNNALSLLQDMIPEIRYRLIANSEVYDKLTATATEEMPYRIEVFSHKFGVDYVPPPKDFLYYSDDDHNQWVCITNSESYEMEKKFADHISYQDPLRPASPGKWFDKFTTKYLPGVKADTTIRYPEMFKPCSDYDSEEDE